MTHDIPLLPCGHRTRHTQRIGCCAGCGLLFSSDSAFLKHRKNGACLTPEEAKLVPKPSPSVPSEVMYSLPPDSRSAVWMKNPQDAVPVSGSPARNGAGHEKGAQPIDALNGPQNRVERTEETR